MMNYSHAGRIFLASARRALFLKGLKSFDATFSTFKKSAPKARAGSRPLKWLGAKPPNPAKMNKYIFLNDCYIVID
jgi:hypothetical protein